MRIVHHGRFANGSMMCKIKPGQQLGEVAHMAEHNPEKAIQAECVVKAGVHSTSPADRYVAPEDPLLLERLSWWQDQKLGLMMHWGPYAQLGIVESWALSDEDANWSRKDIDWETDPKKFCRQYRALNQTFNPVRFQPDRWASLARASGFRYLIFTTKHHDGFSMWDTKQSDYKITGPDCPFHTHRYADICRHLFDAFRREGLAIGAYFSKADWHCPDYWVPGKRGATWRGPGYDPGADPARWEQFVQFTHNQILELTGQYGRIDILWLDAGWVNAANGQDIRLGQVVDKARQTQPWLICADRTVGGPYENYVTPEQTVPSEPLGIPWESCITLGTAFSFRYEDTYKSLEELVTLLVDVVAKGGNLALNVAPQPDGRLPAGAIFRLEALGRWLQRYGEAIYGTRALAPFRQGPFAFTRKNQVVYIFCLDPASAAKGELAIPLALPVSQVDLVAGPMALPFTQDDASIRVTLPAPSAEDPAPFVRVLRLRLADERLPE